MTKVVGVRFRNVGKIYYFSPKDYEIKTGDHVIVETARGIEYGKVVLAPREVGEEDVVHPLKEELLHRLYIICDFFHTVIKIYILKTFLYPCVQNIFL